jgi:hypothetical protein
MQVDRLNKIYAKYYVPLVFTYDGTRQGFEKATNRRGALAQLITTRLLTYIDNRGATFKSARARVLFRREKERYMSKGRALLHIATTKVTDHYSCLGITFCC